MSNDWDDLERLWQSLPPTAGPAAAELQRLRRWRWASYALIGGDVIMTVVGLAAGTWLLSRQSPFATVLGVATVLFVLSAAALSWWARSVARLRLEDPVAQAVAMAVRRARIGVRLALAAQWAICLSLLFTALVALGKTMGGEVDAGTAHVGFMAVAITQAWLALCLAGSILYHRKRTADLARLEALSASLQD
jgi:hypothetical protein